ncbi:lipopolysaccharide transport periplasmic protein LptA [Wenzhouxiangella sp. EGI_FJ10409]|uniref:lipopolysaccharide transport periplasmic protein LptA n=1 Tax=Wenzhouxiangella sp. EGI_FJ10409 TaxID=3243767 RepID=UPI0035DD62FA
MATAEAQQSGPIGVDADNFVHDAEKNASHLQGNVRITRGEMLVTADEGFAYRGANGYERVELFGAPVQWRTVTEEGGETTGRADQVIYNLIERTITLVGEAYLEEPRGTYTGERLVYNLDTEGVRGEGGVRLSIEPEVIDGDDEDNGDQGPEQD